MLSEKLNYQWYAIYTRANAEKKLLDNLQEKNIECYLPTRKVLKVWSDRKKWVEEAMFKCYIFVRVSYKDFFTALNTPGVVCYVSFGGKAQAIPDSQIESIKRFLAETDREVTLTYERVQKGQNVEVLHGSLKGVKGEVVNICGQNRLLIRIDSMSCGIYANISKEEVILLDEKVEFKERAIV
ncbi:MAG: UpxY family transcription antiterminator [Prolixibacteraceae bacterium]|nr:UpxY family transcription antiterminator [Prolixibacteraceae bacterium]